MREAYLHGCTTVESWAYLELLGQGLEAVRPNSLWLVHLDRQRGELCVSDGLLGWRSLIVGIRRANVLRGYLLVFWRRERS
jgi:hypothetical protein